MRNSASIKDHRNDIDITQLITVLIKIKMMDISNIGATMQAANKLAILIQ